MKLFCGISGSTGYCAGEAVVKFYPDIKLSKITITDTRAEIAKFKAAQDSLAEHLSRLAVETRIAVGSDAAEIFGAYKVIVRDDAFFEKVFSRVEKEFINIEYALHIECKKVTAFFEPMDDVYMRERAADIENVCNELIHIMMGVDTNFSHKMHGKTDVILVASDLTPAETVKLDKSILRGIVTEHGGATSHTVILAKALGIPAVVGVKGAASEIKDGDFVQVDAFQGQITVNPDAESKKAFAAFQNRFEEKRSLYRLAEKKPAVTLDGFQINVNINSGDPDSIKAFDPSRCDGIGLFRTEFIYMGASDYPDEHTQFEIYKNIAERANGKSVIIRTLDIGGDKRAPYMDLPSEENPFLGYRAIRFCLDRKDIFATQLRAILRASAFGNIKIMFPMITRMEELLEAKACVEAEKQKLRGKHIKFNEQIAVGTMIETPAAAILSDKLALESAFFSVGSNDLTQYATAADRMNERIQGLYDPCSISVLRLIHTVSESAAQAGIPWSICGEAASEERLIPLWVAMGVGGLSVSQSGVGMVKRLISGINRADMKPELDAVLDMSCIDDVKARMDIVLNKLKRSLQP